VAFPIGMKGIGVAVVWWPIIEVVKDIGLSDGEVLE